jgi:hypothetical protein
MPSRAFAAKNNGGVDQKLHFISGLPRDGSRTCRSGGNRI